jgi:hypothetical protein
MSMRRLLLLGCLVGCAGFLEAGQIAVDFDGGLIPTGPGSTLTIPTGLPGLMGGNSDASNPDYVGSLLFLKFSIPDIADVISINSFVINVNVFDNGDGGGESAEIDFAQPNQNLVLAQPAFTTLNHIGAGAPLTLSYSLTANEIAQVMPSIEDGNFRIRIQRDTGDYYVAGGSAEIDANLAAPAPEPSTAMLGGGALLGFAAWLRRRQKR